MLTKLLDLLRDEEKPDAGIEPQSAAAALMFEIIWADHDIDPQELQVMSNALAELFAVDLSRVEQLVAEAQSNHEESVGLYEFTRALNEHMSAEAKVEVVAALWRIAYADSRIDRFEEHMIRRVAELLYVPHADFISAKHAARSPAQD